MSFDQGLSGLAASGKALDVIGNNVANAGTVGFKGSQAQFADVYAASLNGAGGVQIGIGTRLAAVAQQFTQGNISTTNNPLDIAINGNGFFRMSAPNGAISFTRNGQFQLDKNGFIVNSDGLQLTGYDVDSLGNILNTGQPSTLQMTPAKQALTPNPTANVTVGMNLDARMAAIDPAITPFSITDSTSYNSSTSATIYDTQGNAHTLSMYFAKDPAPAANQWRVYSAVDGTVINPGPPVGTVGNLYFNQNGTLNTTLTTPITVSIPSPPLSSGVTNPQSVTMNFSGSTQFGGPFNVNTLAQDGYTFGTLAGFNVSADGTILGRYTNGQSKNLGQVVLANFANPQGLQANGGNQWVETAASGLPIVGVPGTGKFGALQSGAVEDSNVDLTVELVNMITAQRNYQANAQTIKTQDSILQTITNLR
jgi:flagellar hook protein FlgE